MKKRRWVEIRANSSEYLAGVNAKKKLWRIRCLVRVMQQREAEAPGLSPAEQQGFVDAIETLHRLEMELFEQWEGPFLVQLRAQRVRPATSTELWAAERKQYERDQYSTREQQRQWDEEVRVQQGVGRQAARPASGRCSVRPALVTETRQVSFRRR